jgi:hypothetical protein
VDDTGSNIADLGPRERAAKASTLLHIFRLLSDRQAALGLDGLNDLDGEGPLQGVLVDTPPFGNTDAWATLAGEPPPRRRRPPPVVREETPVLRRTPRPHPRPAFDGTSGAARTNEKAGEVTLAGLA